MHGSMKTPKVSDPVPIAVQMEELPALDQNTFFSDAHENEAAKVETEHYEDVAEEFQKVSDEDAKFFAPATD